MGVHTTLAELQLPSGTFQNTAEVAKLRRAVTEHMADLNFTIPGPPADGASLLMFFIGAKNSHAVVRVFADGILVIDVTEHVANDVTPVFTQKVLEKLMTRLKNSLDGTKERCLPTIRRGEPMQCYFPTTDNLFIEYDFTECVFETDSAYQNIKIMHSSQFGNMLILDDDPNLAESDLAYTQAITGWGHESYTDRTVLLLGGGDGGILHEVLKQKPRFITMVDIDGAVVQAATRHLRGVCHDSMDKLKGDNYEVLIADCVPILEAYGKDGIIFDYVINDLTAIPCTTEPIGDLWDFLRLILELSMKVLSPTGKYYTQGNGANMVAALSMYEKQLGKLKWPVDFKTNTVCVPSYHEMWVFYEIWKKREGADESKT